MENSRRHERLPSIGRLFFKALVARKPGLKRGDILPSLAAHIDAVQLSPADLAAYASTCHFPDAKHLPMTAPHILAAPLHTALLTDERFPLKALGLIHATNRIVQHRPLPHDASLKVSVSVGPTRWVAKGVEFDLLTHIRDGEGIAWEEISTIFSRAAPDPNASAPAAPETVKETPAPPEPFLEEAWHLAGDLGRRYAKVSGDHNPIHLWAWSARIFGFKRPIIHGMWTLARSAAALQGEIGESAAELSIRFRRPVLLPCEVRFRAVRMDAGVHFELRSMEDKELLTGSVSAADPTPGD